jgi:hypothetical protein
MAVLMAVLKNIYIFAENRTGPASNRHPTHVKSSRETLRLSANQMYACAVSDRVGYGRSQFGYGLALRRGPGSSRRREHLGALMGVVTLEDRVDTARGTADEDRAAGRSRFRCSGV